jgi:hypothetical protein
MHAFAASPSRIPHARDRPQNFFEAQGVQAIAPINYVTTILERINGAMGNRILSKIQLDRRPCVLAVVSEFEPVTSTEMIRPSAVGTRSSDDQAIGEEWGASKKPSLARSPRSRHQTCVCPRPARAPSACRATFEVARTTAVPSTRMGLLRSREFVRRCPATQRWWRTRAHR